MLRHICAALMAGAAASVADAQQGNRDYYTANLEKETAQLLRNVEQYHIGPGLDRLKAGNITGARSDFEFILKYFPNHPRALMLMSDLCGAKIKDPGCNVDSLFEKAIARNSSVAQTHLLYGVYLQRRKNFAAAVESYKRALAINPSSANAHYNLGLAYFEQKQYGLANEHAQAGYSLGLDLPGLRDKLTGVGQWKPLAPDDLRRLTQAPDKAANAPEGEGTKPQQ